MSERTTEILLIAPNLLGQSLAIQLEGEDSELLVRLKKEELTKHPSLIIWSLENVEIANSIQIELKRLEENWQPSPFLLILPSKTKLSKDELLQLGSAGIIQDPDLQALKEAISIVKDGGRVLNLKDSNKKLTQENIQTLGFGQWLLISGIQQINQELGSLNNLLDDYNYNFLTQEFLKGRKRELLGARFLLLKLWAPISSDPRIEFDQNKQSNLKPIDIVSSNKQYNNGTNIKLKRRDKESIWNYISNELDIAIKNSINLPSAKLLAIESLNPTIKQDLYLALHNQLNKVINRFQLNQLNQDSISQEWMSVQEEIRREALRNLPANYMRFIKKGTSTALTEELIKISDFTYEDPEIPDPQEMLCPLMLDKPVQIDGQLITPDDPRALIKLEIFFNNWLIRNSEILAGEVLSACAEWPEIRKYFLKENLISTRELERLRNQINNTNRWINFIERPIQLYESKRQMYKFSNDGIQSLIITEPRDEELRNLGWWQQQIALLIEARDAIAPQLQSLIKRLGDLMVVLLTQVLGRSLGLIGRGIAQGMGRTLGRG